jgi:hypothetical protein
MAVTKSPRHFGERVRERDQALLQATGGVNAALRLSKGNAQQPWACPPVVSLIHKRRDVPAMSGEGFLRPGVPPTDLRLGVQSEGNGGAAHARNTVRISSPFNAAVCWRRTEPSLHAKSRGSGGGAHARGAVGGVPPLTTFIYERSSALAMRSDFPYTRARQWR